MFAFLGWEPEKKMRKMFGLGWWLFLGMLSGLRFFLDVNNGEMDSQYVLFMEGLVWRRRKGRFCKIFFYFVEMGKWEKKKREMQFSIGFFVGWVGRGWYNENWEFFFEKMKIRDELKDLLKFSFHFTDEMKSSDMIEIVRWCGLLSECTYIWWWDAISDQIWFSDDPL